MTMWRAILNQTIPRLDFRSSGRPRFSFNRDQFVRDRNRNRNRDDTGSENRNRKRWKTEEDDTTIPKQEQRPIQVIQMIPYQPPGGSVSPNVVPIQVPPSMNGVSNLGGISNVGGVSGPYMVVSSGQSLVPQQTPITAMVIPHAQSTGLASTVALPPSSLTLMTSAASASKISKAKESKLPTAPPRRRGQKYGSKKKHSREDFLISNKMERKNSKASSDAQLRDEKSKSATLRDANPKSADSKSAILREVHYDENVKNHRMNEGDDPLTNNEIDSEEEDEEGDEEEEGLPPPPPYIEVYTRKGNIFQDMIDTSGQNSTTEKIVDFL